MATLSARPVRSVEVVPVGVICALAAEGRLPALPSRFDIAGLRGPTLAEAAALTWAVAWNGPPLVRGALGSANGVVAWRDVYDYTHGRDVRELVHIAGSKRATIDMLRCAHMLASECGRALIGTIADDNVAMAFALRKLGARRVARVTFEAVP